MKIKSDKSLKNRATAFVAHDIWATTREAIGLLQVIARFFREFSITCFQLWTNNSWKNFDFINSCQLCAFGYKEISFRKLHAFGYKETTYRLRYICDIMGGDRPVARATSFAARATSSLAWSFRKLPIACFQ